MKKIIIVFIIGFSYQSSRSQDDSTMVKRIVDETMTNGTAYKNLRVLCKQVGARLSGSPQFLKAVAVTTKMLKDAGADTVFTQECMVHHWVRGQKEKGYVISANGKRLDLHLCALGNSEGSGSKGVSGDVVEVKSMQQLDDLGRGGIAGKIVFFNFRMNPTYITVFSAYGESGVSRNMGPARAAKYGATGAMVRSLAINLNDYPHTGVTAYNDSFPKIPAVAISTNDAEYLDKQLMNGKVHASFTTYCKNLPDVPNYNVVGELRGSTNAEEIITVGGHLDSWDLAEGANDDGAGAIQCIEVLRTLKAAGIKPKRTIRAVLFANEENGGKGGEKYMLEAKRKHEKHVFALESDGGGFTPRGFGLEMDEAQRNEIISWKPLFYPYGVYDIKAGGSGSDVEHLKEIGTALAGLSPDSQRYFDIHHAATDVFENVSERELELGAANMAALVYLVSEHGLPAAH